MSDEIFVMPFATRLRVAGIGGGLGAAVGVLALGATTTQLLLVSAGGFMIGAAIGFSFGGRIKGDRAVARTDRLLKADVVARIVIAWGLVALGIAGLVIRGWDIKIALVTFGFLIVALLCTFHRGVREGPDFERYRR
jgi:hypothetical protein